MSYETVIGLEIHVELDTKSKIFCSCSTKFGQNPNENTCPICMGYPGTLPVLNEQVVKLAIKAGKALDCKINNINKFDRKNYFYPDLPKAYQISQFDIPICEGGYIDLKEENIKKRVNLTRIHLEEDAGKLVHDKYDPVSMIDYNRTGVPLIEIVTEPDMRSAKEAIIFLKSLKSILKYSEISDCKMEQGSLRCDANISIREKGSQNLNTKVEIKNMNSFKEIEKAILKEEKRQIELYQYNEQDKIKQETRKWDSAKGRTISMRSKEDAHDYRYFHEPDLESVVIDNDLISKLTNEIPELPQMKQKRFMSYYNLDDKTASILVDSKELADYFEKVIHFAIPAKDAANWIIAEILHLIKEEKSENIPVKPRKLADLIKFVNSNFISHRAAKSVLPSLINSSKSVKELIKDKGLSQINEQSKLKEIIKKVIEINPNAIDDYKNGEKKAIEYLVGQVMKETKGKANPNFTKKYILETLK